jgi:hypothetical protein
MAQFPLRLQHRLSASGTDLGIVRNPDDVNAVRATGADAGVCDLEHGTLGQVASFSMEWTRSSSPSVPAREVARQSGPAVGGVPR